MINKKILVIDDEQANLRLFVRMFRNKPVDVECAASYDEAMEKLPLFDYDVIFLDMLMPGKDGFETLRMIRGKSPDVPVVMMTGFTGGIREEDVLAQGATEFIYKPFEISKIYEIVDNMS